MYLFSFVCSNIVIMSWGGFKCIKNTFPYNFHLIALCSFTAVHIDVKGLLIFQRSEHT